MPKHYSSRTLVFCALFLILQTFFDSLGQDKSPRPASLAGRVVDARTGQPIAKVKVIVSGMDQNTTTDDNGAFVLERLPVGRIDLYITTVTYGLVKKTIIVKEGDNADFQIALNEDAAALTETVTISSGESAGALSA